MAPEDIEGFAETLYEQAGFAPDRPRSALRLAGELLGWDRVVLTSTARDVAALSEGRLVVRRGAPRRLSEWRVSQELARWALALVRPEFPQGAVDLCAACIRAPRAAVSAAAECVGPAFSDIAHAFRISETSAAMRYAEVTGAGLVLFAPNRPIRVRGIVKRRVRPRVIRLHDNPARIVRLFAA